MLPGVVGGGRWARFFVVEEGRSKKPGKLFNESSHSHLANSIFPEEILTFHE
jgi:hypothetical protein